MNRPVSLGGGTPKIMYAQGCTFARFNGIDNFVLQGCTSRQSGIHASVHECLPNDLPDTFIPFRSVMKLTLKAISNPMNSRPGGLKCVALRHTLCLDTLINPLPSVSIGFVSF
jgi:hypothetical protein